MSIYGPSKKTPASGKALPRADLDLSEYVRKSGARMTGRLNMGNKKITDLAQPTDPQDAATAKYVGDYAGLLNDRKLEKTGGTMTGDLAMSGYKITGLGDPIVNSDAVNKGYTDNFANHLDNTKVNKRGDTMTGSLNMGQEKITNLGEPTENKDAATKEYVDSDSTLGSSLHVLGRFMVWTNKDGTRYVSVRAKKNRSRRKQTG